MYRAREDASRRRFLAYLAGSPLLAAQDGTIPDVKSALNVMDFEAAARKAIPPAHFGNLATGVDDDLTLRANREGWGRIKLRPRRLVDVTRVDTWVELFGTKWETPIAMCPVAGQKAYHEEGELAVARAGRQKRTLQMLSTLTSVGVEEVSKAAGRPVWFQLYVTSALAVAEKLVMRAEAAGCPVLLLTVDLPAGRNTETSKRMRLLDKRNCTACHGASFEESLFQRPMFEGIDTKGLAPFNATLTWDYVDRLRKMTKMKLVLKGIVTREDALLCREHGVDGIVVSNHGGRRGERPVHRGVPAGSGRWRGRKDPRSDRWRHPERDGRIQGAGARCQGGVYRQAICLGSRGVWSGGRREGAGSAAHGVRAGDEAVRNEVDR